jgi:copper chaperone
MIHFDVKGMNCNHCARAVTQAVKDIDQDAQVTIDLARGAVDVQSSQPPQTLAAAITEAGYEVTGTR